MKRTFDATLGDLFPVDDDASPWLFRLAVIRDDLTFEIEGQGEGRDTWQKGYFLRRTMLGLYEAVNIFQAHLSDREFERITGVPPKTSALLVTLRQAMKTAKQDLPELRNRIGGHLDPANAVNGRPAPPKDAMKRHLGTHAGWGGEISLGPELADTSFRAVTSITVLLAWPDVVSEETLDVRLKGSLRNVARLAGVMTRAIDGLLVSFWKRRGVLPAE